MSCSYTKPYYQGRSSGMRGFASKKLVEDNFSAHPFKNDFQRDIPLFLIGYQCYIVKVSLGKCPWVNLYR